MPRSFKLKYIGVWVAVCWYVQLKSILVVMIRLKMMYINLVWLKSCRVTNTFNITLLSY